jgi:hypothetical protein
LNKPTEKEIETYIRFPEELTDNEILRVEKWIEQDKALKMLAEWFASFYDLTDELSKPQSLQPSKLNKIDLEPMPEHTVNKRRRFVLSAQTAVRRKGIDPVHTFISEEHRTLIRVLDLKDKQTTQIHLLSDQVGSNDVVLLHFINQNLYLASQPGGKIEISYSKLSKEMVEEWSSCTLLLPILTASISRDSFNRSGFIGAKSQAGIKSIMVTQAKDEVIISADSGQERDSPRFLLLKQGKKKLLLKMYNGSASIPRDKFRNRNLSMFFYK